MNKLKKFGKTSFIYLLGTVFSKAAMFLLLPIYTQYLTPSTYGLYDLSITYNTLVFSILYLDIFGVIMRFMFDFEEKEKEKPIINGFIIFIASTILYTLVIFILSMFKIEGFNNPVYLILVGVSTNLQQTVGFIARAFHKNKIFVVGGMIGTIITFCATFLFLVVLNKGYEYIYISTILGMLISSIYIWNKMKLFSKIKIANVDFSLLKEMQKYALPLSVNSAAIWFLTGFNRFIISNQLSLSSNGFYAVATKFSGIVNLVTTGFQMAFQELVFEDSHQDRKTLGIFYTRSFNTYISFLISGISLVLPFLNLGFPLIVDTTFSNAKVLIPLALLSAVFSSLSSFLASMLSALKKTNYIFTTTVQAAIVNVVVVVILINYLGVQAANISLVLGFGVIVFARLKLVNKFVQVKLNYKNLFANLLVFLVASLVFIKYGVLANVINIGVILLLAVIFNKKLLLLFYKKIKE